MVVMTVKQVSILTGASVRALQFYDNIGLLKPTKTTEAGYRMYDEQAVASLQEILFYKELDFTLREIKEILDNPQIDRMAALTRQREQIMRKRDRLNELLERLDKEIGGENSMEEKDFDVEEYIQALEQFKSTHRDEIVKQLGSMESFEEMITQLKGQEQEIARMALKQFGSVGRFVEAMKNNLGDFLDKGSPISPSEVGGLMERTEDITRRLTSDLSRDPSCLSVQELVDEMVSFANECNRGIDMGENYWGVMADNYLSNPIYIEVMDKKYGVGAAKFIGTALKVYLERK
jgi:DNA-binding transcriptional MerR regulator